MSKAIVSVKFGREMSKVRLVVSLSPSLTNPIYSNYFKTKNKVAKLEINGLNPVTQYHYGVEVGGILQDINRGMFKTYPTPNQPASFKLGVSSCHMAPTYTAAFDAMLSHNVDFFIHTGDWHYGDIGKNDIELYRGKFNEYFAVEGFANFYSKVAVNYMWDDHDYGGNDADKNSPSKEAAHLAYRETVPHYPLQGNGTHPINQSFVVGRVRFIMTDLRSMKDNKNDVDTINKTMMGTETRQWLFDELMKPEPLKVWVNSVSWIGAAQVGTEDWRAYTTERNIIADFIKNNNLANKVCILSGDMHSLAIDNGINGDYATGGGAPIPVFQAGPLFSPSSIKGGPWSEGTPFTNMEQWGLMTVTDNGVDIQVKWEGFERNNPLVTYAFMVGKSVDTKAPTLTITPSEGQHDKEIAVVITADEVATIYYTLDGSTPTVSINVYNAPIPVSNGIVTLKCFAVDSSGNSSAVMTREFSVSVTQKVSLQIQTGGIRTPKLSYDEVVMDFKPLPLGSGLRYLMDFRDDVASTHIRQASTDGFYVNSGNINTVKINGITVNNMTNYVRYNERQVLSVKLKNVSNGLVHVLMEKGGTGNINATIYNLKILNQGVVVAHYDMEAGTLYDQSGNNHSIPNWGMIGGTWVVDNDAYAVAHSFPVPDAYDYPVDVTLTPNRSAAIHYTLDGTEPSKTSSVYSSKLNINSNKTLKYITVDGSNIVSPIFSRPYNVNYIPQAKLRLENGFIKAPSLAIDEVELAFKSNQETFGSNNFLIDYASVSGTNFSLKNGNTLNYFPDDIISLDGHRLPITGGAFVITTQQKHTLKYKLRSVFTTAISIGSSFSGTSFWNMDIFEVKLLNKGVIVAHYKMSTGDVLDVTGNNNHATLTGGTFI